MLEVRVSGFDYPARISKRLVLADSPDEVDTGKAARTLDDVFKGEISSTTGPTACPARRSGFQRLGFCG